MPRFVILRHQLPPTSSRNLHWDLMFEHGDILRTWALPIEPSPGISADAEQLADHRVAYLDYEGAVSHDRGFVARWDWGHYDLVESSGGRWNAVIHGKRLCGAVSLERRDPAGHSWRVSFGEEPTKIADPSGTSSSG